MAIRKDFYVYCLLDPRKPGPFRYGKWVFTHEPFYVGKGSNDRAFDHLKETSSYNPFKGRVIRKILKEELELIVTIKKKHLSEIDAFELEKSLISKIGRRQLKLGPLTNLTDGGEGVSGKVWSNVERLKQSIRQKKRHANKSDQDILNFSNTIKAAKRRSPSEYQKDVSKYNSDIQVITKFISYSETKHVEVKRNCGCRASFCSRSLTNHKVRQCFDCKFKQHLPSNITIIESPKSSRALGKFKCEEGHVFEQQARMQMHNGRNKGCPICGRLKAANSRRKDCHNKTHKHMNDRNGLSDKQKKVSRYFR